MIFGDVITVFCVVLCCALVGCCCGCGSWVLAGLCIDMPVFWFVFYWLGPILVGWRVVCSFRGVLVFCGGFVFLAYFCGLLICGVFFWGEDYYDGLGVKGLCYETSYSSGCVGIRLGFFGCEVVRLGLPIARVWFCFCTGCPHCLSRDGVSFDNLSWFAVALRRVLWRGGFCVVGIPFKLGFFHVDWSRCVRLSFLFGGCVVCCVCGFW